MAYAMDGMWWQGNDYVPIAVDAAPVSRWCVMKKLLMATIAACSILGQVHATTLVIKDPAKVIACVKQALTKMEATQDQYEAEVRRVEIELCATENEKRAQQLRYSLDHQSE